MSPSRCGLNQDASLEMTYRAMGLVSAAEHWFAVYTTSRHEKRVAQHLAERGIEHFLPLYAVARRWKDGSRVTIQLPLLPNYLFVRIDVGKRVAVLNTPGVLSLVGPGRKPRPLPQQEIEALRTGLLAHKPEPHPYLIVGRKVRITRGPLAGMEGILLRKQNDFRVVLTLTAIMRSIAVVVDSDDVEPCGTVSHLGFPPSA